jgi:hypothetical protein
MKYTMTKTYTINPLSPPPPISSSTSSETPRKKQIPSSHLVDFAPHSSMDYKKVTVNKP